LEIVFETTVLPHALVQRILATVSERCVPEVMRQRNTLNEVFIQHQVARD
jgi:hypothetical protein